MMKQLFAVVIAGVLLAGVSASPCTDICLGSCELSAQTSQIWLPYLQPFIQPNLDACRAVCMVSCNCADTCSAQCGGRLTECRGAPGANFFLYTQCQVEFMACGTICASQCSMATAAGIMDRISRAVLNYK